MKIGKGFLAWGFAITLVLVLIPSFAFKVQSGNKEAMFFILSNDYVYMLNFHFQFKH